MRPATTAERELLGIAPPLPAGLGDFMLSRHLMLKLLFDENELLTKACQRADEQDIAIAVDLTTTEEGQLKEVEEDESYPTFRWGDGRRSQKFASC